MSEASLLGLFWKGRIYEINSNKLIGFIWGYLGLFGTIWVYLGLLGLLGDRGILI